MIKTISSEALDKLTENAASAERLRAHLNVHESLDARVQRLFIATEPDTYIRPHRHSEPHKWELFTLLEGEMELLIFNDNGDITQRTRMARDGVRTVEIPPNTWHSYVCLRSGTLALEIKEGPYVPSRPDELPAWSPAENSADCAAYLDWMRTAKCVPVE